MKKEFDTLTSRQILKNVFAYLFARHKQRLYERTLQWKKNIFHKPLGTLSVLRHSVADKLYGYLYDKGIVQRPRESIEVEFDKKINTYWHKVFLPRLLEYCKDKEQGNAFLVAEQDGKPCFSAVGAFIYRDLINKAEFDISKYPYSKSFSGGNSVPRTWAANQKGTLDSKFEQMFLDSFDIDRKYTVSPSSGAYYSRGLINMCSWFAVCLYQNEQIDFFIEKFLFSYMRLVLLEQRKLDVSSEYIKALRKKWEQEIVHDFTLGVTLIGLSNYAFVYKSLPMGIQQRVHSFRARNSYEKQGVYRRPVDEFNRIKRT